MIYLNQNIAIQTFYHGNRNYCFTEVGELYVLITTFCEVTEVNLWGYKNELVKFDITGKEIERIDLYDIQKDVSDFYLTQEKDPSGFEVLQSILVWKNEIVISTVNNRCYIYLNGILKHKYAYHGPFLDPVKKEDILAQKTNFAAHFFIEKKGKLYLLTNGSDLGRTNSRGRFIAGLSTEKFSGFGAEPFASNFLTDVWNFDTFRYDKPQTNVYPPNMDLTSFTMDAVRKKIEITNPMIFQIIDLNEAECIVSVFTDWRSKSAYGDIDTPYYFFKVNKRNGEIGEDISPKDNRIYKNGEYLIVDDTENKRLIFKTLEFVYFYDYTGKIIEAIELATNKLAQLKKLRLIGKSDLLTYFYDAEKMDVLGIAIGKTKDEFILNVNVALKKYKSIRK